MTDPTSYSVKRSVPRMDALRGEVVSETAAKSKLSNEMTTGPVYRDPSLQYPISGLTPATYTSAMRDADAGKIGPWMELCEQFEDRDGTISEVLATRREQVVACPRDVEPYRDYERRKADEDALPRDREIADFVRMVLEGIPYFDERLLDLLDALGKGIAALGIKWARGGARQWTVNDLVWVPGRALTCWNQETGEVGELRVLTDAEPDSGEPLEADAWIIHSPRTRSIEPYRAGLMRILGWYYCFKHFTSGEWLSFLETFAHPLRLGYFMQGASQSTKDSIVNACQYMAMDQYAVVERSSVDEKPIETVYPQTREASDSFHKLIAYCDNEIRHTTLHQILTTTTDGKGSYKLAETHQSQQDIIKATDSRALSSTIREQLIKPLVRFNFTEADAERAPYLRIHYEPPKDLAALAKTYGILARDVGVPISLRHVHSTFGTKAPDGDDDVAGFQPAPSTPFGGGEPVPTGEGEASKGTAARPDGGNDAVVDAMEMELPIAVAAAVTQYSATVNAWVKSALGNNASRVGNYLVPHGEFASAEEFADEFVGWMDKAWSDFWAAGAMDDEMIAPYIAAVYGWFKTQDMGAFPKGAPQAFGVGDVDQRFIDFMNRSDRFFFSKFVNNKDYRGPLKKFLIDEYGKAGGQLFGPKNKATIEAFKKAAGAQAQSLSKYEVDRVIRSTVSRGRNWARLGQFVDAGVEYGTVMNGGNPCQFCQDLSGEVVSVRQLQAWVESATSLDDDGFAALLQERTDAHRAAVKAGTPAEHYVGTLGPPGYHSSCECTLVYER